MTNEEREQINRSDLEKIDANIDYLNSEMADVGAYQADLFGELELDEELLRILIRVPISESDIEK